MSDEANVIDFRPRDPDDDAPIRTRPRQPGQRYCLHRQIELDHGVRRAYCRACKQEVDAFDALAALARDFERWVIARDRAESDARRVAQRLEALKREERNAKARARRRG